MFLFTYPLYNSRLNLFRQSSNKNASNVRPIFSAEDATYYHGDGDFFGKWFTEVSSAPFSTTNPNYIHNLFSAERLYYNDWRTPGATHGDANLSSVEENIVKPGATQWFTSSMMLGQLDHPALFYTNDAPKCTTSTTVPIDINYQGPLEEGLQYNFTLINAIGDLQTQLEIFLVQLVHQTIMQFHINQEMLELICVYPAMTSILHLLITLILLH